MSSDRSSLRNLLDSLRGIKYALTWRFHRARHLYPAAILVRRGQVRMLLARRSSDIVIEGYPRSGNTFAVQAFESANEAAQIAHHLHTPVQISRALAFGVPAMVVVRRPEDAVASVLVKFPYVRPKEALREWVDFHRYLLSVKDQIVIAPFEEVTTELGLVIRRVNERYGTNFVEYVNSEERDSQTFRNIDSHFNEFYAGWIHRGSRLRLEESIGRPSDLRRQGLDRARFRITSDGSCQRILSEAKTLYEEVSRVAFSTTSRSSAATDPLAH